MIQLYIKAKEPTLTIPKITKKVECPFNYDLERMKDRVENQAFHTKPSHVQSFDDFDKWLTGIAKS